MSHILYLCKSRFATLLFALLSFSTILSAQFRLTSQDMGDGHHVTVIGKASKRYLLLPIQESAPEARMRMLVDNQEQAALNIRLAVDHVDYVLPFDMTTYQNDYLVIKWSNAPKTALVWEQMHLADHFDAKNTAHFRPSYHFTPAYGWMNDPNGMFYKDGVYHLYYQYNPYASVWGNMHWGHATSTDLVHWTHQPIALAPDALGAIFSGSTVVDKENVAGFGKGAVLAFYTSAGERQKQCIAYSLDNGQTFHKYLKNPVVVSNAPDFRDPKVIYYASTKTWVMVLAVGQHLEFWNSKNLLDWNKVSEFGHGQGEHGGVWECPDLIEMPVRGTKEKKWVLIVNINPGGPFGGSATQYFVGDFDGKTFTNDTPSETKWMDWGKDHYATVTWHNAPDDRKIAMAWMSNWQYAAKVPTKQYRSGLSIPRELSLYQQNGSVYMSSQPVPEMQGARHKEIKIKGFDVREGRSINKKIPVDGGYELRIKVRPGSARIVPFALVNKEGERVNMHYDLVKRQFHMDRRNSGQTDFHPCFSADTYAPILPTDTQVLTLYFDQCGLEAFAGDGTWCMTNLVFPQSPYNKIEFTAPQGTYHVSAVQIYSIN